MGDFTIRDLRVSIVEGTGDGGDYFQKAEGHWLIDTEIANPMSGHAAYKARRMSWGIGVLGSIVVEIISDAGVTGVATGFGGPPAAWLIQNHFRRFLIGADARQTNRIWDQMFRASMPYGRKGLPVAAISAVDLALWDLLGKQRGEPVVNLIGGRCHDAVQFYCTGPDAAAIKRMGFWGAKVPLPHGPADGPAGIVRNLDFLAAHRDAVGDGYPLMVDCYMALTVPYAVELARRAAHLDIHWWEEVLHPDDVEGFALLRQAHPQVKWTTGEHEYTRYGFRRLIEGRQVDVLQPDVMWVGGLTALLQIAAHAAAYDLPVIPHGSGPYSTHFVASQPAPPLCEYVAASADGGSILPVFGALFEGEEMPQDGKLALSDAPGFGMVLAEGARLRAV